MSTVEQLATRLARLEESVNQLIVRAIVTQVDGEKYRLKVKFPAQDDVESDWLQVLTPMSHVDKVYTLPDIDEQVLVLNVPGAQEVGYVLGTSYSDKNPPPLGAASPDITMINFGNGSFIKHNRANGNLDICVTGIMKIVAAQIFSDPEILVGADLNPQPIVPLPYIFEKIAKPGGTPEAPGPVEGPLEEELIG